MTNGRTFFDLARPSRSTTHAAARQEVRSGIAALLATISNPAFVVGRRLDILATNAMARALLCDFDALPRRDRNHARWVFLDPAARERYLDWETVARGNVAMLRMEAGRFPDDPELTGLIGELSVKSSDFVRWWAEHDVKTSNHGTKRYRHPVVGDMIISYEAFPVPGDDDQTLFVYSTEPGSGSAAAMQRLAAWATRSVEP